MEGKRGTTSTFTHKTQQYLGLYFEICKSPTHQLEEKMICSSACFSLIHLFSETQIKVNMLRIDNDDKEAVLMFSFCYYDPLCFLFCFVHFLESSVYIHENGCFWQIAFFLSQAFSKQRLLPQQQSSCQPSLKCFSPIYLLFQNTKQSSPFRLLWLACEALSTT